MHQLHFKEHSESILCLEALQGLEYFFLIHLEGPTLSAIIMNMIDTVHTFQFYF
jgi:hypothetical protein